MSMISRFTAALSFWMDIVAEALSAPFANLSSSKRRITVIEDVDGIFTMRVASTSRDGEGALAARLVAFVDGALEGTLTPDWAAAVRGSSVELELQPDRFVFRPLELPGKAAEFLDGIIRSQIDRLTPWNATDALFHWTEPKNVDGERIGTTVVATGRAATASFVRAFSELGAAAVNVSTMTPEQGRATVFRYRSRERTTSSRLRPALAGGLIATAFLAMLSIGVGGYVAEHYETMQQQIQRRIGERRAILRGSQAGLGSSPLDLLIRRKQTTPSSVMVIEALSATLPQHTYATEIRIEGDKLQIVGLTRDAPSLIQILEQSPYFSGAGFFAPTTHAASETGERFHIEVKLKPYFGLGT
ncbi:PilN domain-containing protein [Bradyrhizobium sp. INPA01-394B]|uniref:PilN domain-containing protein n=1 Tax=Bradyrhizobium campsiandrae TaxID=1729892 RepID=A0ABR7UAV9_9BRAD|nr:PilN domain-containing protein [Bradyrhizobium campsiandrae]MBC9879635.1 PilN domain-containing protein [Bradyrhizobium campsiandrae]MBC9980760.1 PilN domain-containing protein [Bradyrhizobium campsiandrae]